MTETMRDWLPRFSDFAIFPDNFEAGDFVELQKNAPKSAQKAYGEYIRFISHGLIGWDDLVIKDRRIVGMTETATGKSKEQCEIVLRLIEDGWIRNDPFIRE